MILDWIINTASSTTEYSWYMINDSGTHKFDVAGKNIPTPWILTNSLLVHHYFGFAITCDPVYGVSCVFTGLPSERTDGSRYIFDTIIICSRSNELTLYQKKLIQVFLLDKSNLFNNLTKFIKNGSSEDNPIIVEINEIEKLVLDIENDKSIVRDSGTTMKEGVYKDSLIARKALIQNIFDYNFSNLDKALIAFVTNAKKNPIGIGSLAKWALTNHSTATSFVESHGSEIEIDTKSDNYYASYDGEDFIKKYNLLEVQYINLQSENSKLKKELQLIKSDWVWKVMNRLNAIKVSAIHIIYRE